MKQKFMLIGGVVAIGIVIFFIFGRGYEIKNVPVKEGPIVAFGDSLVEGVGSSKGKDFISLLSEKLGKPIINMGVSGDTTELGLGRIDKIIEKEPSVTLLLLGGNDFLRKVPRNETYDNLKEIITKLQESGSAVVLMGVRGGLFTDSADDFFEELAEETGSVYISNILAGLFTDSRYMSDAIHPNDAGYARIAERVYPEIVKILR